MKGMDAMEQQTTKRNTRIFIGFLLLAGFLHFFDPTQNLALNTFIFCAVFAVYAGLILFWIRSIRIRLLPTRIMFVPAVFGNAEVSEEQKAAGVIAILSTADGAGRVSITYQNLGEMDDEAFVEELEKAGATDIDPAILNGGDAMSYDLEVNGTKTTNVVIPFEGGDIVTFSFAPMDDEGFKGVAAIMIASIQDAE